MIQPALSWLLLAAGAHALNIPNVKYAEDYCATGKVDKNWDFIIVGAGSAGAVIARRLSENSNWNILLIEAGGNPTPKWLPGAGSALYDPVTPAIYEWQYYTADKEICKGFIGGACDYRRAKALGGCSSNNFMQYVRGNREVYDQWADENPGWSYEEVLPLFKKSENFIAYPITDQQSANSVSSVFHSDEGRLTVDTFPIDPGSQKVMFGLEKTYASMGFHKNIDPNGNNSLGYATTQATIHNGFRVSTARAFLQDVPSNLKVCKHALVDKIIFEKITKTALGVEFILQGKKKEVFAKKEVVISAGTFGSVCILERSGVGRKDVLSKIGVKQLHNLPGVGENLQDHFFATGNLYAVNKRSFLPPNLLTMTLTGFNHYMNLKNDSGVPDIQVQHALFNAFFLGAAFRFRWDLTGYLTAKAGIRDLMILGGVVLHPTSAGHVHSTSKNPQSKPKIIVNAFATEQDQETMLTYLRHSKQVADSEFMAEFEPEFMAIPQCTKGGVEPRTDEYFRCLMKTLMTSLYHPVGTCKMGPTTDKDAVVDNRLKVHGIHKLRIADASIMPNITRGNTNAPTIMIGEKMAEILMQDYD